MRKLGIWLVPVFLLLLGLVLVWIGGLVNADAIANTAYINAHSCTGQPGCVTLSCTAECGYATLIQAMGTVSVTAGFVVGLVRWARLTRSSRSNPPAGR